jgi:hypothetical protein
MAVSAGVQYFERAAAWLAGTPRDWRYDEAGSGQYSSAKEAWAAWRNTKVGMNGEFVFVDFVAQATDWGSMEDPDATLLSALPRLRLNTWLRTTALKRSSPGSAEAQRLNRPLASQKTSFSQRLAPMSKHSLKLLSRDRAASTDATSRINHSQDTAALPYRCRLFGSWTLGQR